MRKIIYTGTVLLFTMPAIADESSHRQAAINMMEAAGIEKKLESATQMQALTYMNQCTTPADSAVGFIKYFEENTNAIREGSIKTYMRVFTEDELNEIAEVNKNGDAGFFQSETGKKLAANTKLLDEEAYKLSTEVVTTRQPILNNLIEECKK